MGVDQNGRDTMHADAGPDASGMVSKSLNARIEARQPTAAHEAARARTVGPQYPVAFVNSDAAPAYSASPKVFRAPALSQDPTRVIVDQGAAYPVTTIEAARAAAAKRIA